VPFRLLDRNGDRTSAVRGFAPGAQADSPGF
jgi:hypothetical protein